MLETLQQLDQNLLLFLNGLHAPFWDNFMWLFSGKWIWVPMYATILYVLLKNYHWKTALSVVIAIALTITFADQVCATFIRPLCERMRPSNPNNPISEFVHILHGKRGGRYGFPSCHAANSFGLAFFCLLWFRRKSLSAFLLVWATVNSYSRIYLGVHYPGDLLVGMLVGLCGALLIYHALRFLLRRINADTLPPAAIRHTEVTIYAGIATIVVMAIISIIQL